VAELGLGQRSVWSQTFALSLLYIRVNCFWEISYHKSKPSGILKPLRVMYYAD